MNKKVLVLGGTGALGTYLVPELIKMKYRVDVVSLDKKESDNPDLNFIQRDAKDFVFLNEILKNEYCAIVDFMVYFSVEEFEKYSNLFLNSTDHYIFTSSYRVYADSAIPITEESPKLLDISKDKNFLSSGDYSLYKAQEENLLIGSGKRNWTILRPTITYSQSRFQLTILEARVFIWRMLNKKTVVLPEPAMDIQGTLSWAGDFGKMVARLVCNPYAKGEIYTVGTSEHHTWKELAMIYKKIGNLNFITTDTESFLNIVDPGNIHTRQQLIYDRYFNRAIDNKKILAASGFRQEDLTTVENGLTFELSKFSIDQIPIDKKVNDRMNEFLLKQN